MKHSYTDKNTGISYTLVGDVYLPNLVLPHNNSQTLGLWGCGCPVDTSVADRSTDRAGRRDQRYLEHIKTHRIGFYTSLKMQCKLDAHLREVDTRASEMYDRLVKQLASKDGITEALKADPGDPEKYFEENFLGKGGATKRSYGNCLQFSASSAVGDDAAWVAAMNNISNRTREIVWNDIIGI